MKKNGPIIIFAGVFDPVHNGHIAAAQTALDQYGSKLVLLPERKPWHKHGSTSYQHRLAMLRLAVADKPNMEVFDYPEEKMTIKGTFTWLAQQYPNQDFAWLIGSDVAQFIGLWQDIDMLDQYRVVRIIVAQRDGDKPVTRIANLPENVSVSSLQTSYKNCSATRIRSGELEMENALHPEVVRYCRTENLYTSSW